MNSLKQSLRLAAAAALLTAAACVEHPESAQDDRQYLGYGYGEGAVIFDVDGHYVKSDTALTLPLDTAVSVTRAAAGDTLTLTRAATDINDLAALKATARGFSVFASYTGLRTYASATVSPDFMCNQQVTWDGTYWNYAPVKYWPNGYGEATDEGTGEQQTHVSFFAYAPWSDCAQTPSDYCVYDCSQTFDQGDAWVNYRLAEQTYQLDGEGNLVLDGEGNKQPTNDWLANQTDLLYAIPLMDEVKPAVNERLKFSFRHALGTVGDDITIRGNDCTDLTDLLKKDVKDTTVRLELILNSVSIDYILTAKGRLTLWTPLDHLDFGLLYHGTAAEQAAERQKVEANWSPIISENVKTKRTVGWTGLHHVLYSYDGTTSGTAWQQTGYGVYYIPVEGDDYVQRATVTAHYTVRRYTSYEGEDDPGNVYTDYDDSATTSLVLHKQEAYGEGRRMGLSVSMRDIKTRSDALIDLATANMTGTVMPTYTYDGHAWQPAGSEMTIMANGQTLTKDVDYTIVGYENNVHTSNVSGYNDDCVTVTKSDNQVVPSDAIIKNNNGSGTAVTSNYNITYVPAAITYTTPKTIDSSDIQKGWVITNDGRAFPSVSAARSAGYSDAQIQSVVVYIYGNTRFAVSRTETCSVPYSSATSTVSALGSVSYNGRTYNYRLPTTTEAVMLMDTSGHITGTQINSILTSFGATPLKDISGVHTGDNVGYWVSDQPATTNYSYA